MKILETERLEIRRLQSIDKELFAELFTDPKVLELIPQKAFTENQIKDRFNKSLNLELIGLALFLINEEDEKELGYRFREKYWGKGYGTEITKGMLEYYFKQMKVGKVTADVNIANVGSVKILDKFMKPVREFFNERDNCTDRRYELTKNNWLQQWL